MKTISVLDDRTLIQLYKEGNEEAFKQLLFRHKDTIFRFLKLKVKDVDLANDIFQETCMQRP